MFRKGDYYAYWYSLLSILTILVLFGFAHTVLDRMRLSDKAAIFFLIAMIVGTFIPNIPLGNRLSINLGGAVIPVILSAYLFIKAGTGKERNRSIIASIITASIIFYCEILYRRGICNHL